VAVLMRCHLCDEPVTTPFPADGHTFCCHGCRELWRLLGDEQLAELKQGPGVNWAVWRDRATQPEPAARPAGPRAGTVTLDLDGLWCASCSLLIEEVLRRVPGVYAAKVEFAARTAEVLVDTGAVSPPELTTLVRSLGYGAREHTDDVSDSPADLALRRRLAVSAVLAVVVMMLSIPVWSGYLRQFPSSIGHALAIAILVLATPVLWWGGWPFIRGAWASLEHRVPTMDLLIAIGSVSAYAYSIVSLLTGRPFLYFDTACMLITFLLLSRVLEVATRNRATAVIRLLSGLIAPTARVMRAEEETELAVEALEPGDLVIVRPGQRIPVDGEVVDGASGVDEAFLSGESRPVDKAPGDPVYAGTLVANGRLVIRTTRAREDTVLAQTARYIRAAQGAHNRWRRLADRVLRVFVPVVLGAAVVTFVVTWMVAHLPLTDALLRAIAVLVIACPCALSVATPVAVLAGSQRFSEEGFLIRSDEALDRAAQLDTICLDKTGTLTTGRLSVTYTTVTDPDVLRWMGSAEVPSEHPVAVAIVRYLTERGIAPVPAEGFSAQPGFGVEATVEGHRVRVGAVQDPALLQGTAIDPAWTVAAVEVDGVHRGLICVEDTVRPEAPAVVKRLADAGYAVVLMTGDREDAAAWVAGAAGITEYVARMLPADKAEWVRARQAAGHRVAFVGDGINDAPALVQADLGIALASGSDIAREAGHLVLARSDLRTIPEALDVARQAGRVIRQNLFWALAYNSAALPAAAFGFVEPVIAAGAMLLSSVFVLGNSLRVLGWSPRRYVMGGLAATGYLALLALLAFWKM
jgi:Cu2+-exporting ATPase